MKQGLTLIITVILFSLAINLQAHSLQTQKWQTKNGAQVIFYQAMEVAMLDIDIAFAAGSAYDDKNFGLSTLTTQLLDQGNGTLNANQVAENLANTGAQYEAQTSRDMALFSLRSLTKESALNQAIATFSLIINQPNFSQEAFNREKNQLLMTIAQMQESPDDIANMTFLNYLYLQHPYGHPINGTQETVKNIKLGQVREFYKRYYVAANAVIVMVGAITEQRAHQLAEQITAPMPQGEAAPNIPQASLLPQPRQVKVDFPSSQTILRLGQLGIEHNDPHYFPLLVGNYILGGGGLVSRLAYEVREQRGLTYGITSQFIPMPGKGPFIIGLATKNNQAPVALKVTQDTLNNFLKTGPSEEEITAAKLYLTGSYPLSLASNGSIAGMLLRMTFYHLPDDFLDTYVTRIKNVTREEIKMAFAKQLQLSNMLLVSVGKI